MAHTGQKRKAGRRKINWKLMRAMIKGSRILLRRRIKTSPSNLKKLRKLATCQSCPQAQYLVQRGGFLPILPLLAAIGPVIAKAIVGAGASVAAGAAASAIGKAINKKK